MNFKVADEHYQILRRLRAFVALALSITLGILSRKHAIGWYIYDKSLGDLLYAVAAYLALVIVFPRRPPSFIAIAALLICLAVELFKLTGIPAQAVNIPIVPWLLGRSFAWHNLACYGLGVLCVFVVDRHCYQSGRRP